MIKLKSRLSMAANMVRKGSVLADIGTDHAYLPSALVLDGTVSHAIASDLRKGPLENAESTVRENNISDKIELRLSDGLQHIQKEECNDIVIAGMGGILIADILRSTNWIKDRKKKFILQPQSHDEVLRKFLYENGFEITEEKSCFEDNKAYICMSAVFTGSIKEHSPAEIMLGSYFKDNSDSSKAFVERKLKRINTRITALEAHGEETEETEFLKKVVEEVSQCQQ